MPRKQKAKPEASNKTNSRFDDADDDDFDLDIEDEEEFAMLESENHPSEIKLRDWRDVERYKEERELRSLVNDDLDLDFDMGGDLGDLHHHHH